MLRFSIKDILIIIFLLFFLGFSWLGQTRLLLKENIISLAKNKEGSIIYAASPKSIYKTNDKGKIWNNIYNISKINKNIKKLYINQFDNVVYILTEDGLYESKDRGDNWRVIFRGSSDLENDCLCLAASQRVLYLGTADGLFISYDHGEKWHKSIEHFTENIISSIDIHPREDSIAYVASDRGVFLTEDDGKTWRRVYVTYSSEIPEEDYSDYNGEVSEKSVSIYDLVISHKEPYRVYIAVENSIFFTEDRGNSWQQITNTGLYYLFVNSIDVSADKETIFLTTDKGIFIFNGNTWQGLNSNLIYDSYHDLIINDDNTILIAGRDGIYEVNITEEVINIEDSDNLREQIDVTNLFADEPNVEEVQRAAIKYADVDIKKIENWRRQSRIKAFFPDISVSYDKTIYGSSTGQMAIGPRDWSLGLSWEVADLIWNSDETSIDSRSRLTVQLRQDILDQVTHLYYERMRLKSELLLFPPKDELEKLHRELEVEEVTASLNSLTNGYFSKAIQKKPF